MLFRLPLATELRRQDMAAGLPGASAAPRRAFRYFSEKVARERENKQKHETQYTKKELSPNGEEQVRSKKHTKKLLFSSAKK